MGRKALIPMEVICFGGPLDGCVYSYTGGTVVECGKYDTLTKTSTISVYTFSVGPLDELFLFHQPQLTRTYDGDEITFELGELP